MSRSTSARIAADGPSNDLLSRMARSDLLASIPGVRHGITSRVDDLGAAQGNVGFGSLRDKVDAWAMREAWCSAIGLDATRLVTAHQIHGAEIVVVTGDCSGRGARPGSPPLGEADALLTNVPGVVLMTLHADCLPVLLVDPEAPAVASVHAGWRGTVLDIVGATVSRMAHRFGSRPDRIRAFLGPSIGVCCYEVGAEVIDAWRRRSDGDAGRAVRPGPHRPHLDLAAANRLLLERAGIRPAHIDTSPVCTRCQGSSWFSHRGQGAGTGRFGAIIALGDPTGD